jgi:hypothetical protein
LFFFFLAHPFLDFRYLFEPLFFPILAFPLHFFDKGLMLIRSGWQTISLLTFPSLKGVHPQVDSFEFPFEYVLSFVHLLQYVVVVGGSPCGLPHLESA